MFFDAKPPKRTSRVEEEHFTYFLLHCLVHLLFIWQLLWQARKLFLFCLSTLEDTLEVGLLRGQWSVTLDFRPFLCFSESANSCLKHSQGFIFFLVFSVDIPCIDYCTCDSVPPNVHMPSSRSEVERTRADNILSYLLLLYVLMMAGLRTLMCLLDFQSQHLTQHNCFRSLQSPSIIIFRNLQQVFFCQKYTPKTNDCVFFF